VLLGIVGADGRVGYLTPTTTIDDDFVAVASHAGPPGQRFRFASPCVEAGCAQWTGSRCAVIDAAIAVDDREQSHTDAALPRCAIRPTCRWFAQSGSDACKVCPFVITEYR
jgi:hypothetical protein